MEENDYKVVCGDYNCYMQSEQDNKKIVTKNIDELITKYSKMLEQELADIGKTAYESIIKCLQEKNFSLIDAEYFADSCYAYFVKTDSVLYQLQWALYEYIKNTEIEGEEMISFINSHLSEKTYQTILDECSKDENIQEWVLELAVILTIIDGISAGKREKLVKLGIDLFA